MRSKVRAVLVAMICALAGPIAAKAQTSLRWNLKAGEKLTVEVTQKTRSDPQGESE